MSIYGLVQVLYVCIQDGLFIFYKYQEFSRCPYMDFFTFYKYQEY